MSIHVAFRMSAIAGERLVGPATGSVSRKRLETFVSEQLCEYRWALGYRILDDLLPIALTSEAIRRAVR